MPASRGRALSDALKLHLDDLIADLRLTGGYEARDWVGENGDLRITLPYGTWRWGTARGDELIGLVKVAGRHGHYNSARAWAEEWLAGRDPNWRKPRGPRIKRNVQYNEVPTPESEAKLRMAYPDLTDPELWKHFGITAPWRCTHVSEYLSADNRLMVLAGRLEHPDQAIPKEFAHVAHYGLDGWRKTGRSRVLREPIPLYNLPALVARPKDPVLVVEGEKTADRAAKDFPQFVVTTWLGGANRVLYADWSPLRERHVAIWPDNDEGGLNAGMRLRAHLRHRYTPWCQSVPVGQLRLPPHWDLADEYAEGFSGALALREIEKALGEPDWLQYMNANYAVVNVDGTRAAVFALTERRSPRPFQRPYKRWSEADEQKFHLWFENRLADGEDKKGNLVFLPWSRAWLQKPNRTEFNRLIFDPSGAAPGGALNLYQGPEPRPDEQGPRRPWVFLRFVYDVICSRRYREFKAVLQLLAGLVQHPERPWGMALVLRGLKGVGKTKFIELVCDLIPAHSIIHTNYEHAMSRFNEWLEGCVVVGFDESLYAGDKKHESYLKNMITGQRLQVEGKFKGQREIENVTHVILAGNPERLVNATVDERRYLVVEVSEERRNDQRYFEDLTRAWLGGEREQVLNLLVAIDDERQERREVVNNREMIAQKAESLDDVRQWLLYESTRSFWKEQTTAEEYFGLYLEWAKRVGRLNGQLIPERALQMRLKGIFKGRYRSVVRWDPGLKRSVRGVFLPPAGELAELALPGGTDEEHLTDVRKNSDESSAGEDKKWKGNGELPI